MSEGDGSERARPGLRCYRGGVGGVGGGGGDTKVEERRKGHRRDTVVVAVSGSRGRKRPSQLMPATRDELFTRLSNQ